MYLKLKPELKDNKIVHVFFNEVLHPALKDEDAYAGKLKKLMQININNSTEYSFLHCDRYSQGFFGDVIRQLCVLGYQNAVIWFDGNWPGETEFDEEVINAIDNKWNETNWLAAGHILQRGTDAPQWHEQCIVLNLKAFEPLLAHFESLENVGDQLQQHPGYRSSTEHMHDDYTPMWVSAKDAVLAGHQWKLVDKPEDFNDDFFNTLFPLAFLNGLTIHNLDYDIRKHKICCYVEDDLEFTKEWFFDYDFNTRLSLDESRSYGYNLVNNDKRELFQYKVMDTHIMYVTNTEMVPQGDPLGIDTLVAPCSGLHQFKHISHQRDTIKRILWTDFSPFGIGWTKHLLENWDGKDFPKFYKDNFHVITDLGLPSDEFIWYDEENALDFIRSYKNEEEWLEHWDFIKTLDHQFIKIDIVKEWKRLSELIGKDCKALLQLSNIWQYDINYIHSPDFDAQVAFIDLFNELLQNNETIYFSGDTPGGEYYEYKNMRTLPGIF